MTYRDDFREVERQSYWSLPRIIAYIVVVMVAMYGLGFLATGGDLAIYRFWAPKQADAQRQVFENTQAYVQGKTDYLNRLRLEYESDDPGPQKEALRQTIITEAGNVDNSKLPIDLQSFIQQVKTAGSQLKVQQ